jgi:VanZ family protein
MAVSSERVSTSGSSLVSLPAPRRRIWRYGPLILWAALIFIGSTDLLSAANTGGVLVRPVLWLFPQLSEGTLKIFQFVVRKAGHFTEYAVLALLAARAFRTSVRELLHHRWFWVSLLLVVAYSLSDEFHQSFYPSRTGSIYDSMIDSFGGLVALTILWWRRGKTGKEPKDFKSSVVV